MTRETEIKLARLFLNGLEKMKNTPDDWRKVIDAFSAAAGDDPEAQHRAYNYLDTLQEVVR